MKRVSLLLVLGTLTLFASAQKLDASKVPAAVREAFAKQYPNIKDVKWEMEDGKYEASFKQDGKSMSTLQNAQGNITETETSIKVEELPASASAYVKEHYKGQSIKEASKITKANGEINFEAELKGKDVVFDATGKFLKEQKD